MRVCIIENEGPPSLFQQKLADKAETWDGDPWTSNVFVYQSPWGSFSFADPDSRRGLTAFCDEHEIDVVCANPTLGLGVAGTGSPDETNQFVEWLVECGLKTTRAFWLLHHENKAGQISGDWGRHPDTKVQLQADGKQPRTKLTWAKTRWATLTDETTPAKQCFLDWVLGTKGYSVSGVNPTQTAKATGDINRQKVLEAATLGATAAEIAALAGLSDKTVRTHLQALEQAGELKLGGGLGYALFVATIANKDGGDDA